MNSIDTRKLSQLSDFTADQVTPTVLIMLEFCHFQQEQVQALRDEIARLKGQKPKPNIKPSKLGQNRNDSNPSNGKFAKEPIKKMNGHMNERHLAHGSIRRSLSSCSG